MVVGPFAEGTGALEGSYEVAFRQEGCQTFRFNMRSVILRYCRLGRFGRMFNEFVPVEPWIRKANRELIVEANRVSPDLMVVVGSSQVRAGALAQILTQVRGLSAVWVWPDTLLNVSEPMINSLPLYDIVAAYSRDAVPRIASLGGRSVEWIPLGADPDMHKARDEKEQVAGDGEYRSDVSFIGGWRPERERVLMDILSEFGDANVKIWGPDWGRRCKGNKTILRAWQGRGLFEKEFAKAVAVSKINLNIIDDTNYPAANMRFFEIPSAGGLQVCSPCPEMETEFRHGETIFYYRDKEELLGIVRGVLGDDELQEKVARAAHDKVLNAHTYRHRVRQILRSIHRI